MNEEENMVEIEVEAQEEETLKTNFIISDGKEDIRVIAMKNCWGIQRWKESANKVTKEITAGWVTDRYVVDIGMVAHRVFELRLKNSEASTILELSAVGKRIAEDVRREFSLGNGGCGCAA